jgi:hypothetical protein
MSRIMLLASILILLMTIISDQRAFADTDVNSKYANPDMSVNFLTLYQSSNRGGNSADLSGDTNGFSLQEAELQFFSDVDPYFRANVLLSVSQSSPTSEYGIDPEEVFVETTSLSNITFKIGKFKAALDRQNLMHTHALPFIDASLIDQRMVGDSLNEVGVSAAVLMPVGWFSEVTAQVLGGQNAILFNSGNKNSMPALLHLRNLWDISDELTVDWGVTGVYGANSYDNYTHVYGSDVTFKWQPMEGGKYRALNFTMEYLAGDIGGDPDGEFLNGASTWLQYKFAEEWWAQCRYDYVDPQGDIPAESKESYLLAYNASEFSGFRLQYDHLDDGIKPADDKISVQMNITIGAHPAHSY